ncbi:MAG: hypothetical protein GY729_11955 [Desulfobacteraceae bacterium]|nr:hypothetical protein [Desulfobacteraceae bacterium]
MLRSANTITLAIFFFTICFLTQAAMAGGNVNTGVRVIHASSGPQFIDPGLRDIVPELKSVFRYTSYRLIKQKSMNLNRNQQGKVNLPGNRTLVVTPTKIKGKRIQYSININKAGQRIFNTQVSLKNNSSITIGGPKFKKGYLLFNISGRK